MLSAAVLLLRSGGICPRRPLAAARCGVGVHAIAQGGVESPQLTCVALCALRLPGMASEVVASAAVPAAGEGAGAAEARAEALLGALLPTLCVHDWGLFGGDV